MNVRIVFLPNQTEISVPIGTLISDAAKRAGVFIDAPCGRNGSCGKCGVMLECNGTMRYVLACQTHVTDDCVVQLFRSSALSALAEGYATDVPFEPFAQADRRQEACFACFDLGTTTIVCYILDARTGAQLAVSGCQNPQSAYGADVIARANHTLVAGSPDELQSCAVSALNRLILDTTTIAGRNPDQISLVTIVGNTVMHHLLLGYPVEQLVRAPYIPYESKQQILSAQALGLATRKDTPVLLPPVVGGFVGADTVACMSATAFNRIKLPTLLIDIGTNGELVLTDGTKRACCSTAAGPAFEGANISCGMRAESGAIDHVWMEDRTMRFSTIQNAPAKGICGSGIVELTALLVQAGALDEGGRLSSSALQGISFVTLENGMRAVLLADGRTRVTFSQKDVRELQLGKAAMRAGIETLLDSLSLGADQIDRVLLAGAFGAHLSPAALCGIGLLPSEFLDRTESVGNAAGEGAKIYARNFPSFLHSERLAQDTAYLELTLSPAFNDRFVDAIAFPSEER